MKIKREFSFQLDGKDCLETVPVPVPVPVPVAETDAHPQAAIPTVFPESDDDEDAHPSMLRDRFTQILELIPEGLSIKIVTQPAPLKRLLVTIGETQTIETTLPNITGVYTGNQNVQSFYTMTELADYLVTHYLNKSYEWDNRLLELEKQRKEIQDEIDKINKDKEAVEKVKAPYQKQEKCEPTPAHEPMIRYGGYGEKYVSLSSSSDKMRWEVNNA